MIKICFVCHGNICRSPMAEFIFRDMVRRRGLSDKFHIESRATSAEELGNPVYPPARAELARHGLRCDGKVAIRLARSDYDRFDLFIGMDGYNIRNMDRLFGSDPDGKINKLLVYAGRSDDVADPWYTDRFDIAYRDICEGCAALLDQLIRDGLR